LAAPNIGHLHVVDLILLVTQGLNESFLTGYPIVWQRPKGLLLTNAVRWSLMC